MPRMWIGWWLVGLCGCGSVVTTPPPAPPPSPPTPPPVVACADKFIHGLTSSSTPITSLCHTGYAVLHSPATKTPLVVAEHLEATALDGPIARTDDYRPDPLLPVGARAELEDYRNSGFDRGHMAPAADFTTDAAQMSESFLLSNMVPQNHTLNAGWWEGLESATRACAKSVGAVYVLTGPVFSDPSTTIGPGAVRVPSSVFKVITDGLDSRAYMIANAAPVEKTLLAYQVPISSVEAATGLNFFPEGGVDEAGLGKLCKGAYGP